jgi:hypothetical protein
MSSDSSVVYVGLRYDVAESEMALLEEKKDHRQLAARKVGLRSYWGNFGVTSDSYQLLVGTELGVFGVEGSAAKTLDAAAMSQIFSETSSKLKYGQLEGQIALHILWQPDR